MGIFFAFPIIEIAIIPTGGNTSVGYLDDGNRILWYRICGVFLRIGNTNLPGFIRFVLSLGTNLASNLNKVIVNIQIVQVFCYDIARISFSNATTVKYDVG